MSLREAEDWGEADEDEWPELRDLHHWKIRDVRVIHRLWSQCTRMA